MFNSIICITVLISIAVGILLGLAFAIQAWDIEKLKKSQHNYEVYYEKWFELHKHSCEAWHISNKLKDIFETQELRKKLDTSEYNLLREKIEDLHWELWMVYGDKK